METLKNLNKLWRTTALLQLQPITTTYSDVSDYKVYHKEVLENDAEEEEDDDEEEESFFEMEVVMLNSKTRDEQLQNESCLRPSSNEVNNGRRVVPVEPDLKSHLQSPVSILKSTPKFKVSLFRNHINNNVKISDLKLKQRSKVNDSVKQKPSATTISTLIRESNGINSPVTKQSIRKCKTEDNVNNNNDNDDDDSVSNDSSSSKRFSKDVMHNYLKLKLIKPFHLKLAKRCTSVNNNNSKSSRLFDMPKDCSSTSSSSTSSSSSLSSSNGYGFRVVCKQLGKSRSASSMMVGGRRRDESLMKVEHEHDDDDGGIQSAILHCKRSFNSSRDSSVHSSDSNSNCGEQEIEAKSHQEEEEEESHTYC